MNRTTYNLELITPCFCAGANPAHAEIRPASIRGQLRWWFRALGGTSENEALIFGAVSKKTSSASAVRIAVSDFVSAPRWSPPSFGPTDSTSYIWHYVRESGKPAGSGRNVAGPRWRPEGAVAPGSKFKLTVSFLRSLPAEIGSAFQEALCAFLAYGGLGLRNTRGLGAFSCAEVTHEENLVNLLSKAGFVFAKRDTPSEFDSADKALADWSAWLRLDLRKRHKAASFSALGGISPRQTSAVRFRPILLPSRKFTWIAFEAPHNRVLLRKDAPVLIRTDSFSGPAPSASKKGV
jgi:CRISPR type III-B/RAMP module RAMP protein Cmr1